MIYYFVIFVQLSLFLSILAIFYGLQTHTRANKQDVTRNECSKCEKAKRNCSDGKHRKFM